MIVTAWIHYQSNPLSKEVCTWEEMIEWIRDLGPERLDKIILTDLRPTRRIKADGTEEVICL